MKPLLLAAAIAATALTSPAAAAIPEAIAAMVQPAREHDHIRTIMIGDKGPTVVLVPGMSTPMAVWDDVASRLGKDHRLLIVEVRGFDGQRASANERPGLIDGIVADLAADLAERKLGHPVLAGHSFGGLVALKFALAHPAVAKALVIIDALPFFGTVFADDATVESIAPRAKQMHDLMIAQADSIRAAAESRTIEKDPGGDMSFNPAHRVTIANWSMKADPAVVAQALLEDMAQDLRQTIAAIAVPITVLYQAQADPAESARRYRTDYAASPRAALVPVERTGHFIPLDRPDAVTDAIRAASR